jgi:hypothetical protein
VGRTEETGQILTQRYRLIASRLTKSQNKEANMKKRTYWGIMTRLLLTILVLSIFSVGPALATSPWQSNAVKPFKFVVEPPTLISLGFEWYIEGDNNHNATVDVWYRKMGDHTWKKALPLLRIKNEQSIFSFLNNEIDYITPNLFAGSILDLEPDTEYQCRFTMTDPDGVYGAKRQAEEMVKVRTRPEPKPYVGGNVYHVYPYSWTGPKQEPAFKTLMDAYYMGFCDADWWNTAPPRVQPGDTILVHAGVYANDRTFYGADIYNAGQGAWLGGTYYLTAKGTPDKPITIKAAGDGEVIFSGNGNWNLFNVQAADYNYFEGLTIRNTDIGFLAGNKKIAGSKGLTVKRCRFEDVNRGIYTDWGGSKYFYIADNVFIGRNDPNGLHGWTNPPPATPLYPYEKCYSEYAIKVAGSGHVICHNYVANFHDGIDHATYGVPDGYPPYSHPDAYPLEQVFKEDKMFVSNDIYNNFITNVHDDCIEADGTMYNTRVMRNACVNAAGNGLSTQTLYGGPAYFIRNILYNVPNIPKHHSNPSGEIYYHNTFFAESAAAQSSNYHFRNNLFLGWHPDKPIFSVDTFTNYTSSDYNGFLVNSNAAYSFQWKSPSFGTLVDYINPRVTRQYQTLADYSLATGQDKHSRLVDYGIFMNVTQRNASNYGQLYKFEDFDFRLNPNSVAVDAGVILPNVNDDFTGKAPDLGALEVGQPMPVYGPRP